MYALTLKIGDTPPLQIARRARRPHGTHRLASLSASAIRRDMGRHAICPSPHDLQMTADVKAVTCGRPRCGMQLSDVPLEVRDSTQACGDGAERGER